MFKKALALCTLLLVTLSLHAEVLTDTATMSVTDINGKSYKIQGTTNGFEFEGTKGKVVILEFFGHHCPPCLASIPHLIDLQKKYPDKLQVIAFEVQGYNNEQLKAFVERKGINYIVVADGNDGGFIDYIARRAMWRGSIPFTVLLDSTHNVRYIQVGLIPESTLEELVHKLYVTKETKSSDANTTASTKESKAENTTDKKGAANSKPANATDKNTTASAKADNSSVMSTPTPPTANPNGTTKRAEVKTEHDGNASKKAADANTTTN